MNNLEFIIQLVFKSYPNLLKSLCLKSLYPKSLSININSPFSFNLASFKSKYIISCVNLGLLIIIRKSQKKTFPFFVPCHLVLCLIKFKWHIKVFAVIRTRAKKFSYWKSKTTMNKFLTIKIHTKDRETNSIHLLFMFNATFLFFW